MRRQRRFPRIRSSAMGAVDPAMSEVFDSELKNFKNTLLSLYRAKTKMIAERESLRFRYTTQMKNKVTQAFLALNEAIYQLNDSTATALHENIMRWQGRQIPMLEYSGQASVPTYGGNVWTLGGKKNTGYLSPITDWLSETYSDDPRYPEKFYQSQQVKNFVMNANASSVDAFLKQYFFNTNGTPGSGSWVRGEDGQDYWFTMPVDEGYVKASLRMYGGQPGWIIALPAVNQVYAAANFMSVMSEARDMMARIIKLTSDIVRNQYQIDDNEKALSQFVADYSQYSQSPIAADEIMRQLELQAEQADIVPPIEVPIGSTIVEQVPPNAIVAAVEENPLAVNQVVPDVMTMTPAPSQTSSKLPLYLAGAAALALLLKK